MHENPELTQNQPDEQEISRQIQLAEMNLQTSSARSLGEVITVAMGRLDDDPEKVAQSLIDQKVFQDFPDPEMLARATVERYQRYGERLREEEKPL